MLCALLLLLSGCAAPGGGEEEGWLVYFAAPLPASETDDPVQGPAVLWETRRLPHDADVLSGLLECLLSGPVSEDLRSPFPDGVYQRSEPVLTDGVCQVDLSERYGGLSGVDLTVADYCIALTLLQVEGVEAVSILVEGEPISYRDHQLLRESDIILSSAEDEPVYLSADLCFLREEGGLAVERRELLIPSGSAPGQRGRDLLCQLRRRLSLRQRRSPRPGPAPPLRHRQYPLPAPQRGRRLPAGGGGVHLRLRRRGHRRSPGAQSRPGGLLIFH